MLTSSMSILEISMSNCYVLCFIPLLTIDSKEDTRRKELITKRLSVFFLEPHDGIEYVHEMNTKALYDIIISSKSTLKLFWIYNIRDYSDSPTSISELIITCLKQVIIFQSEQDDLYFEKHDQIEEVYPKVFDIFKKKIKLDNLQNLHK